MQVQLDQTDHRVQSMHLANFVHNCKNNVPEQQIDHAWSSSMHLGQSSRMHLEFSIGEYDCALLCRAKNSAAPI
jgi:hypothetical protein